MKGGKGEEERRGKGQGEGRGGRNFYIMLLQKSNQTKQTRK